MNTTGSIKLTIRLYPIPDEGVRGYLLRLSTCNGLDSMERLMPKGKRPSIEELTKLLCRDDSNFWEAHPQAGFWHDPKSSRHVYWNWIHRKYCPRCLEEKAYWRVNWELRSMTTCPRHEIRLVDCCPQCQNLLSWKASHITQCSCGYDLRQALPEHAHEDEVLLAKAFEATLKRSETPESLSFLKKTTANDMHQLVRYLGNLESGQEIMSRPDERNLEIVRPIYFRAAHMLRNWPESYHQSLQRISEGRSSNINGAWLLKTFGSAYTGLYKNLKSVALRFVQKEFEQYIQQHWQWALCGRNKRLPEGVRSGGVWIPSAQAAQRLHVRRSQISALVERGEMKGRINTGPSGRVHLVVFVEDVAEAEQAMEDAITLAEASTLMGMNDKRVIELVDGKIIQLAKKPKDNGNGQWSFSRTELNNLMDYATGAREVKAPDQLGMVHLNGLLKSGLRGASALPSLFKEIIERRITVDAKVEGYTGVRGWMIGDSQYRQWLRRQVGDGESRYSMQQVAAVLRTKEESAYRLVKLGLLKAEPVERNGRELMMVASDEIMRFRDRYVFNSQLAEQLKIAPRALLQKFTEMGISPYIENSVGKAFFERTENFQRCWDRIYCQT